MELDSYSLYTSYGDGLNNSSDHITFIKESRKVRKSKIERNKEFHRKNVKSIEHYQRIANGIILTDDSQLTISETNTKSDDATEKNETKNYNGPKITLISKKDNTMNNTEHLAIEHEHSAKINNITNININKQEKDMITKDNLNNNTVENNNQQKQQKASSSKHHYRNGKNHSQHKKNDDTSNEKQPGTLSIKVKNNLQLMFQNLTKHYKRDGIFLDNSQGYESILVMKDFNIHTQIGKTKTQLTVRAVVGEYTHFKDVVIANSTHFSPLKHDFGQWWQKALSYFDAKTAVDEKIEKLFTTYNQDPRIAKFLPTLEAKLIQALKKPTKQPNGFSKKIEQIDANWSEEAKEIVHIEAIENELRFSSYEESFPLARSMERKFSIYIGPTNSGKTYAALNELSQSRSGAYLGPLRLMAHEGRESLSERGIIANLVTGEERTELIGATHVSSTVEMCNMSKMIDVAVIDEIQMIADESRGWAWSQALIGVPAKHVVLVGSEESLPFILPIIKNLGEKYEIKRFERKNELHLHNTLWKFKDLKENDCVVVFSRKSALEMKNAIESTGKRCSVIYGNLSPEVRKSEAAKFKSGENPILVATDAIGMGLNLPINRLFFSTMEKFDGITSRLLNISEIKQIAGRAGRYGFASHGEVGILFDDNNEWRTLLHKAIYAGYEKTDDHRISIAPNLKQIQTICNTLGKQDLYSALIFFKEKMIKNHHLYKTANLDAMIEIASLIKNKNLDLATGLNYACVPLDTGSDFHLKSFFKWMNGHINLQPNFAPNLPDVVTDKKNDSYSLYEAENYVKLCMAYRWLHYKYPETYSDIDTIVEYAKTTNDYIEHALHRHIVISKNPKWKR